MRIKKILQLVAALMVIGVVAHGQMADDSQTVDGGFAITDGSNLTVRGTFILGDDDEFDPAYNVWNELNTLRGWGDHSTNLYIRADEDLSDGIITNAFGQLTIDLQDDSGLDLDATGLAVDPSDEGGLETSAAGLGIKLDTDPGLQLGAGGLSVLLKDDGGLTVDGDGISVDLTAVQDNIVAGSATVVDGSVTVTLEDADQYRSIVVTIQGTPSSIVVAYVDNIDVEGFDIDILSTGASLEGTSFTVNWVAVQ